jgi:hypothetical protein
VTAPRTLPCSECGTPTATSYGVCDPCLAEIHRSDCAEQGIPEHIDDPVVLARIATIVNAAATVERSAS